MVAEEDCSFEKMKPEEVIKRNIKVKYGITMSDDGAENPHFPNSRGQAWDLKNLRQVYEGLSNINNALGGKLKSIIGSATFTLNTHPNPGRYFGYTTRSTIDFYVTTIMPLQNLYHEFGHVLNNLPGKDNYFSDALQNYENRSFITAGQLDPAALVSANVVDPNYGSPDPLAIQHASTDAKEQWADIFANYVAGNINLDSPQGRHMYNFITGVLP
jgi:hypothetical protein